MHPIRKIPTIIGLLLVLFAVFIFSFAFDRISPLLTRASPSLTPKNIMFTNISDTSFTVSWVTDIPATGAIIVDGSRIGTAYDQRDETGAAKSDRPTLGKYALHSVIVRNTSPQTVYRIRILSGGSLFQDGVSPYTVTTAPAITMAETALEPAFGTVTQPDGKPAAGALVYLTPDGGQTLSTFVTPTGSWVIPLHLVRSSDLNSYLPKADRINETIVIRSEQGESRATTDTYNDNPVPAMAIGKDYDFRKIQAETAPEKQLAQAIPNPSPAVLGDSTQAVNNPVDIVQPADGANLTTNLPLFKGTGVAGNTVLMILGIVNPSSTVVTVAPDGTWTYTPDRVLTEGKQSVTITSKDVNGKPVAVTHMYNILKSGTQVLGDATPSATLEPTPTATPDPNLTPEPTSTLAGEPIPITGNELPTLLFLTFGIIFVMAGTAIFAL